MAFDPQLATQAWMATLDGAARARSDAYFEGGYWLLLWGALVTIVSNVLILDRGWAARLSAWAGRVTRGRKWLQAFLFFLPFMLLAALITLPFDIYTGFIREHQYGLSNQNLAQWSGDHAKGLAIGVISGALLFAIIHAVVRRLPRSWWVAGTGIAVAGLTVLIALQPVFIEPLFNTYTPMAQGPLRDRILSMARANGVPATNVFVVDASRQTTRISANVAGLFGTTRVALNDNLLKQPADEVRAVMGHELGHYVLGHIFAMILQLAAVLALMLWVTARTVPMLLARYGDRWGVADVSNPAVLPVAIMVLAGLGLLLTPVLNTITRTEEMQADRFGLNAARAPDAFASTAMKLSQYRKIAPGPIEEALFFDHPSGHTRVLTSMQWKAEHLGEADIR
jgi:STE24 endopeptidase